uniref:Muscarinic acetylcholine receptor n=1 Tax=Petromyzon marinus TaxID=7757 RepID=S4R650_PETMA
PTSQNPSAPLTLNSSAADDPLAGEQNVAQVVVIAVVAAMFSLITVVGNTLVMLSFRVSRQLKTVSNYFLLSLAAADLIVGLFSMNLYTAYILTGRWAMGAVMCDLWLTLDYVASNASVMNLLAISFDRYFSITRPLKYKAKRTKRRASIMIGLAWAVSLVLWAPAILFWQHMVGKRTVPQDQCYIQFLSEPIITFGTAIAAFYLPITIMMVLYWRIYRETRRRSRQFATLQGSESKSRSHVPTGTRGCLTFLKDDDCDDDYDEDCGARAHDGIRSPKSKTSQGSQPWKCSLQSCEGHVETTHEEEEDDDEEEEEEAVSLGCAISSDDDEQEPANERADSCAKPAAAATDGSSPRPSAPSDVPDDPVAAADSVVGNGGETCAEPQHARISSTVRGRDLGRNNCVTLADMRIEESLLPRDAERESPRGKAHSSTARRHCSLLARDNKAVRILCAILLAFIVTWTPYNIMVLVSTFCDDCVPKKLWHLGYWLCYVNSTVNPMCYALCNMHFRKTFKTILSCKW